MAGTTGTQPGQGGDLRPGRGSAWLQTLPQTEEAPSKHLRGRTLRFLRSHPAENQKPTNWGIC